MEMSSGIKSLTCPVWYGWAMEIGAESKIT
jgi:hypothetical protein